MRLEKIPFPRLHRVFLSSAVLILTCAAGAKLATITTDDPGLFRKDPLLNIPQHDLLLTAALVEFAVVASVIRLRNSFQSILILAWLSSLFGLYRLGSWWVGSQGCACFGRFMGKSPLLSAFFDSFATSSLLYLLAGSFLLLWFQLQKTTDCEEDQPTESLDKEARQGLVKVPLGTKTLVAGFLLSSFGTFAADSPAPTNIVEQFKAFLANPPTIESAVYWIQPMNEVAKRSTHGVYFACWQTNAFVIRKLHHPDDANRSSPPASPIFCGRYESKHWRVNQMSRPDFESVDYADVSAESHAVTEQYKVALGTTGQERMVECYLLALGLGGIKPRTICWLDDELSAPIANGKTLRGKLTLDDKGLPLRFQGDMGTGYTNIVEYAYQEDTGIPFIPSIITLKVLIPPDKQEPAATKSMTASEAAGWGIGKLFTNSVYRIHILSMQISERPLPAEHFMPDRFIKNDGRKQFTVLYTNAWSYMIRQGRLEPTLKSAPSVHRPNRVTFLWTAIFISIGFLLLVWRIKKQQLKH